MVLETGDFRVSYGRITALKGVDIKVAENEAVAVIGANGAGKSSLMNGLAGIVEAQGGVLYKGADLSRLPSHQRVKRGLVLCPEGRRIFPELNVEENLRLGAYRRGAVKTGPVWSFTTRGAGGGVPGGPGG